MKSSKNLFIMGIIAITILMTVGYATLAQDLSNLTNSTSNKSKKRTWNVEITKIEPINVTGTATAGTPTFTKNTATFGASLYRAGDSVTYKVTVVNKGTIKARLGKVDFTEQEDGSPAINYTVKSPASTLEPGTSTEMIVVAEYDPIFVESPYVSTKTGTSYILYAPVE